MKQTGPYICFWRKKVSFSYLFCDGTPGYEGGSGEWEEYPPYVNAEGLEIGSPVSILFLSFNIGTCS